MLLNSVVKYMCFQLIASFADCTDKVVGDGQVDTNGQIVVGGQTNLLTDYLTDRLSY